MKQHSYQFMIKNEQFGTYGWTYFNLIWILHFYVFRDKRAQRVRLKLCEFCDNIDGKM